MSLLLKALQNAAKNREGGAPDEEPVASSNPSPPSSDSASAGPLSLEPMEKSPAPSEASSSRSGPSLDPRTDANPTPRGTERNAMANRTRAQNVFIAGSSAAAETASPGIVDWLTRRPLVAFSTAAGLFAIGYGVYLYLQLTNPGMFIPSQGPVATPPPAPSPSPSPVAQAPVPPTTGTVPQGVPEPSQAVAPPSSPVPGSVARTPAQPGAVVPPSPAAPPASAASAKPTADLPPVAAAPATPTTPHGLVPPSTAPAAATPAKPAPVAIATTPREPAPTARAAAPSSRPPTATPRGRSDPAPVPTPAPQVNADVGAAYQALERGQVNDAERLYRQALAADPRNVDAMIGLGAALAQQNRADAATQMYLRALEIDPRNSYAQAGLLNIGGRADPQAAEARLKQLIAREPSAYLYFTLGNLYAEQNQWSAAQGAYFQAFNMAPDNPDYAFNLAIGLEHLSQPKLALEYYRRAVSIAQARGNAQFALPSVQARIRNLETALAERP